MTDNPILLLRKCKKNNSKSMAELRKRMNVCPICGKKAFLNHDVVDGFDFGYSGGCPSFCLNDGIHGISERYDPRAPRVTGYTAREVFNTWERYCKMMEYEEEP